MNTIIKRTWNQNRMVNIEALSGMAFQAEDGGHTFEISGINDANEAVSLSGTVAGVFMRPDGTDVSLTGAASDGVVSVTLSDACYAVDGRFGLYIFVTSDSKKTCVYACIGTVAQTSYGTVAGDTPQDVVDLINAINAAIASIPADYTDLMAAIAPTYSDQSVYPAGAYRWYNGVLYKSKVAITTAESFTAAHWETVALGDDLNTVSDTLDDVVRDTDAQASKLADIDLEVNGGTKVFRTWSTNTMYGSDGSVKTPNAAISFYQVNNINGATSLTFSFAATLNDHTMHWFNQFDANDTLLSHTPFYVANGYNRSKTVSLESGCSYIKVSVWTDNGTFSVTRSASAIVVKKSDIAKFSKVSGIGDSITAGYSSDGTVTNTYQKLIADALGASYQNLGINSTPVCPNSDYTGGQNDNAFVYRYSAIANDADLIIIAGGTNDFRHNVPLGTESDDAEDYEDTFFGACDYLLQNIIANHLTAKIVWITPFHQQGDTTGNTIGNQLTDYIYAIKKKCAKYGVTCIDGYACSGVNLSSAFVNAMIPDYIHPNAACHLLIYKNLMPFFAML